MTEPLNARESMTEAYAVCALTDIPNRKGKAFSLLRVEGEAERPWHIFIVRWDGQLFGYVNRCPHDGVNLDWEADQFLEPFTKFIVCGKHGSLFELATGRCFEGPCKGESLEQVGLAVIDNEICVTGVTLAEA